jgi:hypothetical protein
VLQTTAGKMIFGRFIESSAVPVPEARGSAAPPAAAAGN